MRFSTVLVAAGWCCLVLGCPAANKETPVTVPASSLESAADAAAAVFIGKPKGHGDGDFCRARHRFLNEPAPPPQDDKSVFPDRYNLYFEVVDVVRGPPRQVVPLEPVLGSETPKTFDVQVAIAVANNGPKMLDRGQAYDEAACQAMDDVLSKAFVVVFGRPVYVDRGNSGADPAREAWTLGTDPTKPNRGFDTLQAAQDYVAALRQER